MMIPHGYDETDPLVVNDAPVEFRGCLDGCNHECITRWKYLPNFGQIRPDPDKPRTVYLTNHPPDNPTTQEILTHTWIPYIWPRTWYQACFMGLVDPFMGWLFYVGSAMAAGKIQVPSLFWFYMVYPAILIGYFFIFQRVVAWMRHRRLVGLTREWQQQREVTGEELRVHAMTGAGSSWPIIDWPVGGYREGLCVSVLLIRRLRQLHDGGHQVLGDREIMVILMLLVGRFVVKLWTDLFQQQTTEVTDIYYVVFLDLLAYGVWMEVLK